MTKDELQAKAAKAWFDSGKCATIVLGTGCGKTKVALDILKAMEFRQDAKILLLSNSAHLRDKGWLEEFIKWGILGLWDSVTSECYQTACKWEGTEWDLVIADEIDFSLTEAYSRFYLNNTYSAFLGLTGTVTETKKVNYLDKFAPVCFNYSTNQAQEDGILNKTRLHLVKFLLDTTKTIKVEYKDKKTNKKKSFMTSENDQYVFATNKVSNAYKDLQEAKENGDSRDISKAEAVYKYSINARKAILHSLESSVRVAKQLQREIIEKDNTNKILCFSGRTNQVEKFCAVTYTGNNKRDNDCLTRLNNGSINILGVCAIIDRGANLVGVNNIIMESYVGSTTAFQQRNGRGCRLEADDVMDLYILLPYYRVKSDDLANPYTLQSTKAVDWAINMLTDFRCSETITRDIL